jgi:flagellar motor switch protein FliG
MSRQGLQDAATLLLALGEDAAARVFAYLTPREASELGAAMRELSVLPRERVAAVLRAYLDEAQRQTGFATDSGRFVEEALARALGAERAEALLRRIGAPTTEALKRLAWREPSEVAGWLEDEAPQLAALVLSHLPRDGAAAVLELLPETQRGEVVRAMADAQMPGEAVLADVEAWLAERIDLAGTPPAQGEAAVAHVLASMDRGSAAAVLESVDHVDAPLAARLRARQLGFDDLARLPLDARKTFLRSVSARMLLTALKGADQVTLASVTEAMSPTAARRLIDELDTLGGVPVADIVAAQDEVAALLQRLAAEGAVRLCEEEDT